MRLVVKIGSNLIQTEEGDIDLSLISKLGREIKRLKALGNEVVIVSSGAVLCGLKKLNLTERPKSLVEKQALAALVRLILFIFTTLSFPTISWCPLRCF